MLPLGVESLFLSKIGLMATKTRIKELKVKSSEAPERKALGAQ